MSVRLQHRILIGFAIVVAVSAGARCSNATPPPTPVSSAASAPAASDSGTDSSLGSTGDGASGSGSADTDTSTGTSSGASTVNACPTFNLGEAPIGTPSEQAAVTQCAAQGLFYDRFADSGAGACTQANLASMDCTQAGITAVLNSTQQGQFSSALAGDYSGWTIDQCVDCPPGGTSPQCASTAGQAETGTKVYFVQQQGNTINGKDMVLPVRPAQTGSSSANGYANAACQAQMTATASGAATATSAVISTDTSTSTGT